MMCVLFELLFRRYNTRALVEQYLHIGVPLSVVFTNYAETQRIGVIVALCNTWILLPLHIGKVRYDDPLGFTYFDVVLHPELHELLVREKTPTTQPPYHAPTTQPTYHAKLINYGILLPALWLTDQPWAYALVTNAQDTLGWQNLWRGLFSRHWAVIQERHVLTHPSPGLHKERRQLDQTSHHILMAETPRRVGSTPHHPIRSIA